MKLAAAILFAVTSAQRNEGGRQREKETPSSTDDAFAAYFGAYDGDAFGDYGNAFGAESFGDSYDSADAFGDLTFGNYDGEYVDGVDAVDTAAVEQAVAADEANRPGQDNNDDGKTFLPGDTSDSADETKAAFAAYCWENSASRTDATNTAEKNWATSATGSFKQCTGSASACEIKVVRDVSSNNIVQIVSKCANEDSCIANMEQNFNPKKLLSPTNSLYNSYMQQSCRPQHLGGNAITFGQRFKSNKQKSTCFFCVEPCTSAAPAAGCIGHDGSGNPMSVATGSIDIFVESTLTGSDMLSNNYYSTVSGTITGGKVMTVSKIQKEQLNAATPGTFV